jgi:alkaline phosphatase D
MHRARRQVLRALASAASVTTLAAFSHTAWSKARGPRLRSNPFVLSIASGFPTATTVVLWTKLLPEPQQPDGGLPTGDITLRYDIASDERMRHVLRRGSVTAQAQWAHSVHLELAHLEPARDYFYRFTLGDYQSPIGRTRTLPARSAKPNALHIAVANCQHYEHGHFAAYRHMAATVPDLILHLGDYIYEGARDDKRIRQHTGGLCRTLEDYRARYALYQHDASLQAAHAAAPWLCTWDDHEVANDYSGVHSGRADDPAEFLARRAAAYQAYFEHLPLPPSAAPRNGNVALYARRQLGNLLTVHMLDQRQYRSAQACPLPNRPGGNRVNETCADLADETRTMLGAEQEAWLSQGLATARSQWTLFAQGTLMAHLDEQSGPGRQYGTDAWNGYPQARRHLLADIQQHRVANPVVLAGDIHAFMANHITAEPTDPASAPLATEFVATSISSDPRPQAQLDTWRTENPNIQFAEGRYRGYLDMHLTPQTLRADLISVSDVNLPNASAERLRSFTVESGRAVIVS